jgi:hypothetical protein
MEKLYKFQNLIIFYLVGGNGFFLQGRKVMGDWGKFQRKKEDETKNSERKKMESLIFKIRNLMFTFFKFIPMSIFVFGFSPSHAISSTFANSEPAT